MEAILQKCYRVSNSLDEAFAEAAAAFAEEAFVEVRFCVQQFDQEILTPLMLNHDFASLHSKSYVFSGKTLMMIQYTVNSEQYMGRGV